VGGKRRKGRRVLPLNKMKGEGSPKKWSHTSGRGLRTKGDIKKLSGIKGIEKKGQILREEVSSCLFGEGA